MKESGASVYSRKWRKDKFLMQLCQPNAPLRKCDEYSWKNMNLKINGKGKQMMKNVTQDYYGRDWKMHCYLLSGSLYNGTTPYGEW